MAYVIEVTNKMRKDKTFLLLMRLYFENFSSAFSILLSKGKVYSAVWLAVFLVLQVVFVCRRMRTEQLACVRLKRVKWSVRRLMDIACVVALAYMTAW